MANKTENASGGDKEKINMEMGYSLDIVVRESLSDEAMFEVKSEY